MGIETNPTRVADLNEQWPADGEPALEGAAHLRAIKKAVKGVANIAGQFGVTTLNSATDSDSETEAATPKAVKEAKSGADAAIQILTDQVDQALQDVQDAIDSLDTTIGEGAVPTNGLWLLEAGNIVQAYIPATRNASYRAWGELGHFRVMHGGVLRVRLDVIINTGVGSQVLNLRLLKNGSTVWSRDWSGTNFTGVIPADLACAPGDYFVLQGYSNNGGEIGKNNVTVCTSGMPAIVTLV